jgi:hypothetical protein
MSFPTVESLAQAIAQEEGNNGQGFANTNNPGNLELGDIGYGTATAAGGQQITIFQSFQDGFAALVNMLQKDLSGNSSVYSPSMNLQQYMQTYTGGNTNAGNTVASILGVSPYMPLTSVGQSAVTVPPQSTSSVGSSIGSSLASGLLGPLAAFLPGSGMPGIVDIVAIIGGLILIAGMVFGFRNVSTTIVKGVKTGAEIAS